MPLTDRSNQLIYGRMLGTSALVGVVVALGFVGFERVLHHGQHWVWVSVAGENPSSLVTIALATAGGLALGLTLRLVPGRGGSHPADSHHLFADEGEPAGPAVVAGTLLVGLVGLIGGASLGPEGAVLPAAAGVSLLIARWWRVPAGMRPLVQGAGLAALLAAMFGSPLAGVVPLMELAPAAAAGSMTLLVLPSLTSAAAAVLTLQVLGSAPIGRLPYDYSGFRPVHLLWALLVGVIAGAVGLSIDRAMRVLRVATRRIDARSVVLTAVLGGFVLGVLYAIGGPNVRFSGIPELVYLTGDTDRAWAAVGALAVKVLATAVCLAAGYRGGKIFPVAFAGGAVGLALHLALPALPLGLAVGVGVAAAVATGFGSPVTAALIATMLLGPTILPLAVLGVVVAHTVHLWVDPIAPEAVTEMTASATE